MSLAPRCRRRDLRNERSWQRPSGRLLGARVTCFSLYAYWHCSRSNWINLDINPQTEYLSASLANRRTTILACVGIIGARPFERYDRRDDAIKRYVILTQRYSTRRDATRRWSSFQSDVYTARWMRPTWQLVRSRDHNWKSDYMEKMVIFVRRKLKAIEKSSLKSFVGHNFSAESTISRFRGDERVRSTCLLKNFVNLSLPLSKFSAFPRIFEEHNPWARILRMSFRSRNANRGTRER